MQARSFRAILQHLPGGGLVGRFSLVGLTVGVLLAGALAWVIEGRMTDLMLEQVAARAADQVDGLGFTGYLVESDFQSPHTLAKLEDLASRLDPFFEHMRSDGSGIIRLYLYAPDGTILYSSLASRRGQQIDPDDLEHLNEVLEGHLDRDLSDLESVENEELKAGYGQALEIYVPFSLGGHVVGAYEIYHDLAGLRPIRPLVWGTVMGGFALLLLALFGIVSTAATLIGRQQRALSHQAFHDFLTGLPNRALFLDRVQHAIAQRTDTDLAVLFLDLDNFKVVNDSLGHRIGDALLIGVAERLNKSLRPGDTVARLGGDEFAVLLEHVTDVNAALRAADRIAQDLRVPFVLDGMEVFASASIGMTLGGSAKQTADDLLRDADVAMYRAKSNGRACCEVFDGAMGTRAAERLRLESDLHRALERNELRLHYQPIVSLADQQIVGVEALVRWEHPQRGLVAPSDFIPLAEESGLIVPIGKWVLEQACQQAREWQRRLPLLPPLIMSVNLSARQFHQPDLVMVVRRALRASGLDPQHLKLEITESLAMQDAPSTIRTLRQIRRLGVHIAIDDFGTGYSSLAYLHQIPANTLKIDRSFVDRLTEEDCADAVAVVRTIISLAKSLNLSVTGEGIENAEQQSLLLGLGCDDAQGYYLSRPQPADVIGRLVLERGSAHLVEPANRAA